MTEVFEEISPADFFYRNRDIAGFTNPSRAIYSTVRELVENSLDACEINSIPPDIYIRVSHESGPTEGPGVYRIRVEDNGSGLPEEIIPSAFGQVLFGSKYKLRQSVDYSEKTLVRKNGIIEPIEIGRFVDQFLKPGEDVKEILEEGYETLAFSHDSFEFSWSRISDVSRHKVTEPLYEVVLESGRTIKVTGAHSIFTLKDGNLSLKDVEQMKLGDYVAVPRFLPNRPSGQTRINLIETLSRFADTKRRLYVYGVPERIFWKLRLSAHVVYKKADRTKKHPYYVFRGRHRNITVRGDHFTQLKTKKMLPLYWISELGITGDIPDSCTVRTYGKGTSNELPAALPLSEEFMRFLGYVVAEGAPFENSVTLNFGEHETFLIEDAFDIAKRAFHLQPHLVRPDGRNRLRLLFDSSALTLALRALGVRSGSRNKEIPRIIFNVSPKLQRAFLIGIYRGDGCIIQDRKWAIYSTSSRKLAYDLLYLLAFNGVFPTVRMRKSGFKKNAVGYQVHLYGHDVEKALSIKFNYSRAKTRRNFKILEQYPDFAFSRITKIRKVKPSSTYAYDLSIPGKENFVCGFGGVCCHNTRGTFGLGGKMAILYGQITTHSEAYVMSSTGTSRMFEYRLMMDIQKNKPIVIRRKIYPNKGKWHGTVIEFSTEADYVRAMSKILEYLKQTAIVAPYADLTFVDPKGRLYKFERATREMPKPPDETTPHPHGVDVETIKRLISITNSRTMHEFMKKHFQRVGDKIARRFLNFADIGSKKNPKKLGPDEIVKLVTAMKNFNEFLTPDASCLSPLGDKLLETGIRKELNPEFVAVYQRKPAAYSGFPFIVEIGAACGGSIPTSSGILLYRFANKIPLLFDEASDVSWKVVNTLMNWRHYKVTPETPLAVFVHICSLKIPYKTVGKEFIADRPEVEHEMLNALREVGRQLSIFLSRKEHMEREKRRLDVFSKYLPKIASFSTKLAHKPREPSVKPLLKSIMKYGAEEETEVSEKGEE